MSKYILEGSFTDIERHITQENGTIKVQIPFLDVNNSFCFGIDKSLRELYACGIHPTEDGLDILCLAALVYLADTRISRNIHSEDCWSREICINLPVYNIDKWNGLEKIFTRMLGFLTGDLWKISFEKREIAFFGNTTETVDCNQYDVVTLFSGGMDSLIGTINSLRDNKKIALISHAGESYTKKTQRDLLSHLQYRYPDSILTRFDLGMVFKKDLLPNGGIENSTRSRSFLFIAYGIFTLTGIKGTSVLHVPENGLIALNVPLDELRVGSYSTHTTHPFYLEQWNYVLEHLELALSLSNPYWNKTKGDMANECLDKDFLLSAISSSSSCSSPQKERWNGSSPKQCGYCVPCLIRRAAMAKAFGINSDPTHYSVIDISEIISNRSKKKGTQIRSFQIAINKIKLHPTKAKTFIHKSGPICGTSEYLKELADVYKRGLKEVDSFIQAYVEN